jgi:hypothetical protein
MIKLIYHSRGSLIPALLCAEKHHRPDSSLEQAVQHVQKWLVAQPDKKSERRLLPYNDDNSNVALYVLTATAPPGLVERTLTGFFCLLASRCAPAPMIVFSLAPTYSESRADEHAEPALNGRRLKKLWPEVIAAVEQARLRLELLDRLK